MTTESKIIMSKLGYKNIETTQNCLQLLPKRSPEKKKGLR